MSEKFVELFPVLVLWAFGWMLPASVLALVFVQLRRHGYLRPFADLFHAARRLSLVGWLCVAPLVVGLVGYASTKNDGGATNDAPTHMSAPRRMLRSLAEGWLIPSTPVTPDEIAAGYRAPASGAAGIVPAPEGAVTNAHWRLRGAHDDALRLDPAGLRIPVLDGVVTGVTVLARGEVRPDVGTLYFPVSPVDGVSLLPESRWGLLSGAPGTGAPPNRGESPTGAEDARDEAPALGGASVPDARASVFWHALSPSNTLLLTWENARVGRDPNCPTNLQAELYADGRFAWRTDGGSRLYLPVLDFDWDGDGLENSVDPDPLVAGPDAHGTNAEWYKVVCTNVFTEATGSEPEDSDVPRLLPEGVEFREKVTTNAYYFVDVVAEQGPAPIYFTGDQAGFIGAPVVVARAGKPNRVPLQIGVEYAVTSAVPFSLAIPMGGFAEIRRNDPCEKTVKWPISFSVTTEDDGHTVVVTPCPSDAGGVFNWRRPGGDCEMDGDAAMLARGSSPPPGCSYTAHEGRVVFDCVGGDCTCAGCWIEGDYVCDGVACVLPTVWCGCYGHHGPGDDDPPPTTPHGDMASAPSVSASFSEAAVIFEDVYTNAPGSVVQRQSTQATLRISAYGGANGARLTIRKIKVDEKLEKVGGHAFPTKPVEVPPDTDVDYEFVYEGKSASGSRGDILVTASLVAVNDLSPEPKTAKLTALRADLRTVYEAPENPSPSRHVYGVGEQVKFTLAPALSEAVIRTESFDPLGERLSYNNTFDGACQVSGAGERTYTAPFTATHASPVTIALDGAEYKPSMTFVEPAYIECRGAARNPFTPCLPPGEVGGMTLLTTNYVGPMHVSFQGVLMAEIPCDDVIPPDGYFASASFNGPTSHTKGLAGAGAGFSRRVTAGNYWTTDSAGRGGAYPDWSWGHMEWKIPIGWIRPTRGIMTGGEVSKPEYEIYQQRSTRALLVGGPDAYRQIFSIETNGTAKIEKHGHWLSRSRYCRILLDGDVIQENH